MATEANVAPMHAGAQPDVMECPIGKLADEDLAAVFKHLSPYDRLLVSEVCLKWRDVTRAPWIDVTHLDLDKIPGATVRKIPTAYVHSIIKQCTNLSSISALRQNLGDLDRFASRLGTATSVKCVECTFVTDQNNAHLAHVRASLSDVPWQELIWHNSKAVPPHAHLPFHEYALPYQIPATLRRLQMSVVSAPVRVSYDIVGSLRAPQLECFILADVSMIHSSINCEDGKRTVRAMFIADVCTALALSTSLCELYLDSPLGLSVVELLFALRELKILFLDNLGYQRFELSSIARLISQHPRLCVLVMTASRVSTSNEEVLIPVRRLFPNGLNADPVSQLHLFLGKVATERLRFHPSPTDALKIFPIDAPLPEFLAKEEIKPIFEGSWISSRIREGAKEGINLANYAFEGNAESISYVQP